MFTQEEHFEALRQVKSPTNELFNKTLIVSEFNYNAYEVMLSQDRYMKMTYIEDTAIEQTESIMRIYQRARRHLIPKLHNRIALTNYMIEGCSSIGKLKDLIVSMHENRVFSFHQKFI